MITKFSYVYGHAFTGTVNVNEVELLKIVAAVICPKTVIVYLPT